MQTSLHTDTLTKATLGAIERFNQAFNRHDVDEVMEAMTEDCVFENTYPPPNCERYEGQSAVRSFWNQFFSASPHSSFEAEEMFACGERCIVRWIFHWLELDGRPGHVRGIDLFRVRDGKVAEKLSYVKG